MRERVGGDIWLKAENLQRTGSFKIRGAMSKLAALGERAGNGVTAGSAGNHAQAIAFAARHAGVPCEIFVPAGAPLSKMDACLGYGARVVEGGESLDEAVLAARAARRRGGDGVLPSVRRRGGDRRAGHARPRAASTTSPTCAA